MDWATYTIDFDDLHLVSVDPDEEHGKGGGVHDTETVGLARLERQGGVLVETNGGSDGARVGARDWAEVGCVLRKVDEGRVGHGLGTTGVGDADELVEEDGVLVVVPVAEDDGELGVVTVFLLWWVDDDGGAEAVDVLALYGKERCVSMCGRVRVKDTYEGMRVDPVGSPLAGCVDGDAVIECLARRDTTVGLHQYVITGKREDPYHWDTPSAPSIHELELKNMPW